MAGAYWSVVDSGEHRSFGFLGFDFDNRSWLS